MDAATKPSLFAAWYDQLKNFGTKAPRRGFLPHLGPGAGLVTVFVSSFFVAHAADAFAVIIAYGPHAYFREGLNISNWKHDLLSNGAYLSFTGKLVQVPTTLILWAETIYAADSARCSFSRPFGGTPDGGAWCFAWLGVLRSWPSLRVSIAKGIGECTQYRSVL